MNFDGEEGKVVAGGEKEKEKEKVNVNVKMRWDFVGVGLGEGSLVAWSLGRL